MAEIDLTQFEGHTAGPWAVGPWFDNDGQPEIIIEHATPRGNLVPAVALGGLIGQEANARLIAAAPDLLAEIKRLRGALAEIHGEFVNGSRQLYTTPDSTLDRIRTTAKTALEGTK